MSVHAADVRLITDRADKDLAVEVAIKTFEEVWLSRVFSVCPQQQHFVMGKKVGVEDTHSQTLSTCMYSRVVAYVCMYVAMMSLSGYDQS